MVQINWTQSAIYDLKNIYDYISKDSKKFAQRKVSKIRDKVKLLKKFPNLGKQNPEMSLNYIRELQEGNYRIIYMQVNDNRIDILTIHHSFRDFSESNI